MTTNTTTQITNNNVITLDRAMNDNIRPSQLIANAKWCEREAQKGRYNRAAKNRLAENAAQLRTVAAELKRSAA